jgi:integrase
MLTLKEASIVLRVSIPALKKQIYEGRRTASKVKGYKGKDVWMLDLPAEHQINNLMTQWLDDLMTGKGYRKPYSPKTINEYKWFMSSLWKHSKEEASLGNFNVETLRKAFEAIGLDGCHYSLKDNMRKAFICFAKWLNAQGLNVSLDGVQDLRPKRFTPAKRNKLKQDDVSHLLQALDKHCTLPYFKERMHLLLKLILTSGLRISEALGIRLEHINYEQGTISVLGKGNKPRITVLSDDMKAIVLKWTQKFHVTGQTLFNNLTYQGARIALRRLRKLVPFPLNFHDLRRTCATQWVQMNVPLTMVSVLLGHTSLKTTQLCVEADAFDAVRFVRALPSYF